jgi:gluconokinase
MHELSRREKMNVIVLVMGITGSGKTTVGKLLAARLHWEFADADDFHSAANKQKMSQGIALTDADREPWLEAIRARMEQWIAMRQNGVMTCSALKQSYRDFLFSAADQHPDDHAEIKLLYLRGTVSLIMERLHSRHGHFAGESLVASQLATLEEPTNAVTVDIDKSPEQIADEAIRRLGIDAPKRS